MVDFQLLVKSFYGYEYFRDIFDHRRKGPRKHKRIKKDEMAVSFSFKNCFKNAKYEVEEQSTLFIVCKQTGNHLYDPPIWEINKISSETSDKLECGKFETKRGGGVLWGLGVGGRQRKWA